MATLIPDRGNYLKNSFFSAILYFRCLQLCFWIQKIDCQCFLLSHNVPDRGKICLYSQPKLRVLLSDSVGK